MSAPNTTACETVPQLDEPNGPALIHPAPGHGDACCDPDPCAECELHHMDCRCRRCAVHPYRVQWGWEAQSS